MGAVAAAFLAGCGALRQAQDDMQPPIGAPDATPQPSAIARHAAPRWPALKPGARSRGCKATAPLLFATNIGYDDVTVYQAAANDSAPLATITDGLTNPLGTCVDGQGTLYVTNEPASGGWVSEYPLGKTTPSRIITDGISEPVYCAIDADGNLWVANYGDANVTEYLAGTKKPHAVITKGLVYPLGIAIDRSGDLYVGNFSSSTQYGVENLGVYAPGSKSPSRTITNGIPSPRSLAIGGASFLNSGLSSYK